MRNVRTLPLLAAFLLPLVALTAIATVMLWPNEQKHVVPSSLGVAVPLVNGTVSGIESAPCVGDPSGSVCNTVTFRLTSGPDNGQSSTAFVQSGPGSPTLHEGDKIVLGRTANDGAPATYYFADFQRKAQLGWLGLAFAVVVVLIGRWRGIGALVGLGFTWLVVTTFLLPSVLEGRSPLLLAITSASLIVLVVLYLAHGFNRRTTTALVGTLLGLLLTGALASVAVDFASITGMSSDDVTSVQNYAGQIDIHGLLLAGIVIGALGVLNDVTVTQASSVWEIHRADPTASRFSLYRSGMRVGRDHVASTVYTLVLAYVGAALPLLIIFSIANRSWGDVVGTDLVGEEIVRTIAGSIGLMLAVPITTALAAFVAAASPSPAGDSTGALVPAAMGGSSAATADVTDDSADLGARHFAPGAGATAQPVDGADPAEVARIEHEVIVTDNDTILVEPPETGQINLEAYPPVETKRRFGRRPKTTTWNRKMSRRERKFWES